MITCSMFGALLYIVGEILNNIVWGKLGGSVEGASGDTSNVHTMTTRSKGKKPQKVD